MVSYDGRSAIHLALHVRADQLVDLAFEGLPAPGQHPAVHHRLGGRRDDVGLVARLEHGRVGGVAQRGADDAGDAARAWRWHPPGPGSPGRSCSPVSSATAARNCATVSVITSGKRCRPSRATASAIAVTALSSCTIDPCPARPRAEQPHPRHPLLGGLDQVEPALSPVAARHRQREPADLADRLGDPGEQVGPVLDEPVRAVLAAVLLVGDEGEHQVPRRDDAGPFEVAGDRDHHPDHVLHVDRAAAPHVAVRRPHRRTGARSSRPVRRAPRRGGRGSAARPGPGRTRAAGRTRCPGRARRPPRIRSRTPPRRSCAATQRAQSASPLVVSGSPVLEVSNRISALTRSTTSSGGIRGLCHSSLSYHRDGRRRVWGRAGQSDSLSCPEQVRVAEWQTR